MFFQSSSTNKTSDWYNDNNNDAPKLFVPASVFYDREQNAKSFRDDQYGTKDILINTSEKSTLHGLPSLASKRVNFFSKFVWVLVLLATWAYFGYGLYQMVILFTKYEKITAISVVNEAPTNFPAVDICDMNPYDGNVARDIMDDILGAKNISIENSFGAKEYTYSANDQFKASFESMSEKGELRIYWAGFYLNQILAGCEFQGVRCGSEDFYWYHNYYYGNCFRFNGGNLEYQSLDDYNFTGYDIKKSSQVGWRNGLRLELYAGTPDYQQQYTPKIGFRIIVHNQTIVPFPDEDGIDIPTGFQTNVAISRTFMRRLPAPYSNCINDLTELESAQNAMLYEMYQQKINGKITVYQSNYCQKICYQYFIIKSCGCYSLTLGFMSLEKTTKENITGCISYDEVNCAEEADQEFYNSDESANCYSLCPVECNLAIYKLSTTTAGYPGGWYLNFYRYYVSWVHTYTWGSYGIATEVDIEHVKSSAAMVNIFYDSLTYQVFEEKPKLSLDLTISSIGGNLSLFTGMSILSIVELVEFLMSCFLILCAFRCCKSKKRRLADMRLKTR